MLGTSEEAFRGWVWTWLRWRIRVDGEEVQNSRVVVATGDIRDVVEVKVVMVVVVMMMRMGGSG